MQISIGIESNWHYFH